MSRRALITGITGQDGSYLAELLLAKGYEVHGLIRRSSSFSTGRIDHLYRDPHGRDVPLHLFYGDLADPSSLINSLNRIKPDEVYNLGAQSHVKVSFEMPEFTADTTGMGTLRLLEAIRHADRPIRYYQAGSSEMFGKVTESPQSERTPFYPRSPYAVSKLFAHWMTIQYREAYGLFAANGIMFNHESPRRGGTFVTRKITRGIGAILAGREEKLYLGNLDARRDWGYAPEYVEAMWLMLQQPEPDDFVVATGEMHSVREFVELAFSHVGRDWQEFVEIDPRYFRPPEVDELCGDATKARERLGWRPRTTFAELVRLMVEADLVDAGLDPERHLVARDRVMNQFWADRRVMVTGGGGFLGKAVVRRLEERGATDICVPRSREYDLRTHDGISRALADGAAGAHHPSRRSRWRDRRQSREPRPLFLRERDHGDRAHGAGAPCRGRQVRSDRNCLLVPESDPDPLPRGRALERLPGGDECALRAREEDAARPGPGVSPAVRLQRHPPHPGQPVWPRRQLRPDQLARDPRTHQEVLDARDAGAAFVEVWGTGSASREFLYVDDAAEGIVLAAQRYDGPEPVNLGVGSEIKIRELVELIVRLTGFSGGIRWDATKPDGQTRRALDTGRARVEFGFESTTSLEEGLQRTIGSYLDLPTQR